MSEDERISLMYELNGDYLDDERHNLDIQLSRPILVVGDLWLWNGCRMGYKEIESGNIRDCLYNERDIDYSTWYVDKNGDFRCDAIHHDGTNESFGRDIRFDESGVFTDSGYVRSNGGRFVDIYDGNIENIPEEYRIQSPNLYVRAAVGRTEKGMER